MSNSALARIILGTGALVCLSFKEAPAQFQDQNGRPIAPEDLDPTTKAVYEDLQAAQSLLAKARNKEANALADLNASYQKLTSIRGDLDKAGDIATDANTQMNTIEKDIRDAQRANPEFVAAQAAFARAEADVAAHVLRLIGKPKGAKLTAADKKKLQDDPKFRSANGKKLKAANALENARIVLYKANAAWNSAHQDFIDANRLSKKGEELAKTAGFQKMKGQQEMREAKKIEAEATWFIALSEYRMRRLGWVRATVQTPGGN